LNLNTDNLQLLVIVVASIMLVVVIAVSVMFYLAVINMQGAHGSSIYDACAEMYLGDNWTGGYHNETVWQCDSEVLIDPNG
jgi:hypothetical protein